MDPLSPRQQSILNRVVDTHIETAQPVGSRSITRLYTKLYRDSYSPATVRSEMGALEELGYLTHPHPSAGRVPTDCGYRYYVEHGLQREDLPHQLFDRASQDLSHASEAADSFAERLSEIVSSFAQEICLILLPQPKGRGTVREYRLVLQGASHMLEKPEFQDLQKVRALLRAFEEKMQLMEWLSQNRVRREVTVTIGRENHPEALRECAVIAARYSVRREEEGTLAVIGPKRMRYSQVIPLVEKMGQIMERLLQNPASENGS